MNEPKVIIPDATGLVGREKNPYDKPNCLVDWECTMHDETCHCEAWENFERSTQSYPLTSYQEPGKQVEAVLVWQYYDVVRDCWETDIRSETFKGTDTRQAWQLIKQAETQPTTQMNEAAEEYASQFYTADEVREIVKQIRQDQVNGNEQPIDKYITK